MKQAHKRLAKRWGHERKDYKEQRRIRCALLMAKILDNICSILFTLLSDVSAFSIYERRKQEYLFLLLAFAK